MKEVKFIIPEQGERILDNNVDKLHESLLELPADMYLCLYHMMKRKVENSYFVTSGFVSESNSCCCSSH